MIEYDHKIVDKKWQKYWEENKTFQAIDFSDKEKFYCLVEFPYPSGDGLHVGHPRSYTALDILARKKRMEGFNVLFPMGFDSFGLPSENYAIKTGIHPNVITKENIDKYTKQLKSLGFSFDWDRVFSTTDPEYYKWTQWIFLKLYEKGLAYKQKIPINWCIDCKIGLANEEVVDGRCERCDGEVTKRSIKQWMLKITSYAEKLIQDLDEVQFLDKIKTQQVNWIGRSDGTEVTFSVDGITGDILVFTTRPDTLFGATFMILSPEHELVSVITTKEQKAVVESYIKDSAKKSDLERTELEMEKTGVFTGSYAINPVNNEKLPIWIADYVLISYGTGAIMAVPAHDTRDFDFAQKYGLKIQCINRPPQELAENEGIRVEDVLAGKACWPYEGQCINSSNAEADLDINGLNVEPAKTKTTKWLEEKGIGKKAINYKLRDWVFSRQRYWGEPIPLIHCRECEWVPVPEQDLPVLLPTVEKYEPTETGESPLAAILDWVNTSCPKCGKDAKRETDTMPNWAGSSWYFLRYIDPHNDSAFADEKKLGYWMPVDWYNGGMEHTTLHLLYSRFWNKFLYDCGLVPNSEPYLKRTSHGMVLGEGGEKMSKSRNNVINPDEVVERYGADVFRLYEMFIGPFDQAAAWDTKGIVGIDRFLRRSWILFTSNKKIVVIPPEKETLRLLHQTIKKVSEDIEKLRLNTAISQMMIFQNHLSNLNEIPKEVLQDYLILLSPFAPHFSEEINQLWGNQNTMAYKEWLVYDEELASEEEVEIAVQVNGRLRGSIIIAKNSKEETVSEQSRKIKKVNKHIENQTIIKTIYIKNRLINFVIR
ncbi:MAG TPA: leucine--tRNA ligase [Candidatus Marinimicrobia bacterium]|nr:leucine--tRNA ligase [Candidatus Neomarinimicrobiota bacterium]